MQPALLPFREYVASLREYGKQFPDRRAQERRNLREIFPLRTRDYGSGQDLPMKRLLQHPSR